MASAAAASGSSGGGGGDGGGRESGSGNDGANHANNHNNSYPNGTNQKKGKNGLSFRISVKSYMDALVTHIVGARNQERIEQDLNREIERLSINTAGGIDGINGREDDEAVTEESQQEATTNSNVANPKK